MPDLDNGSDPQDSAEAFDETHGADEDPTGVLATDDLLDDPDGLTDVYDVTAAQGDSDDDDDDGATADDYSDGDLSALQLDDDQSYDEDDDDQLDDDLEDDGDLDSRAGLDRMIDRTAERAAPSEPGLVYAEDLDALTQPRDDETDKYETTQALSDEQLADLGYLDRPNTEASDMNDAKHTDGKANAAAPAEDRAFVVNAETAVEGSGATAEDILEENDADEEDRLDEGLEETFPASDPVSAKHIT
jgi:hypothetical protein